MLAGIYSNKQYFGVNVEGHKYYIMLGLNCLGIYFNPDAVAPNSETLVVVTVNDIKGGEAVLTLTETEYNRLLQEREDGRVPFANWAFTGTDAQNNTYHLTIGNETLSIQGRRIDNNWDERS
ncbi:hypothetical protein KBD61_04580 [Patescibacteria group bacterium]|nr:hypothetical protein [Patescibacteria group bacterium]MBP9710268.1 hypothetical protein [Patescibacteria group bacterium]